MRCLGYFTSAVCLSHFAFFAVACNDGAPAYPAIVIYGDGSGNATSNGANDGTGLVGSGNDGSGNSGNSPSNGGTGNSPSTGGAGNSLYAHCSEPWSGEGPPVGKVQCDLDNLTDGGDLTGDLKANRTLSSGKIYHLKGSVRVFPGATLTIEPCVKIMGESSDSILAVLSGALGDPAAQCYYESGTPGPGGKLVAVGEPMAPIIFTSSKPKGQRKAGDWGGLILMGNAENNQALQDGSSSAGTRVPIEGLERVECHGWHDDTYNDESSGELKYVRIEYASKQLVKDNETNGLTLGSLGRGTKLHYIMVSNSADDCFEWFGGAADADHLIALNCDDDMFDGDQGYSGHLQFLFGRQAPNTTEVDSRGFELDGAASLEFSPRTAEQVSNFTICGGGTSDRSGTRDGVVLRNLASSIGLKNGLVTGFSGAGLFAQANEASSMASLTFTQMFRNTKGAAAATDVSNGKNGVDQSWFFGQTGNSAAEPDRFCDCWANPPVPVAASTAKGTAPTGFADASANYLGALKDSSPESNWMRGAWADWSAN